MDKKIAVVGDSSADHFLIMDAKDVGIIHPKSNDDKICFNYGEKIPVSKVSNAFGGSALNVATSLASLDVKTELVSFIGKDFEGHEIIGHLHAYNIGTDNIIVDRETNQSFAIVFNGERTILSNHLKRNYSRLKIPKTDYIYLASSGEGSEDLVNQIRSSIARGSKLIFNPGSFILRDFDFFRGLLADTSLFIINKDEATDLFETVKIKDQLAKILELGTKVAVITDEKNGAYFAVSNHYFHMHAAISEVRDTTGAGDSFAGALTAGVIRGLSLEEAAKWGMVNSASVIEQVGANSGVLSIAEIDKRLKSNKILKFAPI